MQMSVQGVGAERRTPGAGGGWVRQLSSSLGEYYPEQSDSHTLNYFTCSNKKISTFNLLGEILAHFSKIVCNFQMAFVGERLSRGSSSV